MVTGFRETTNGMRATFVDGAEADFALVFGADGVHSGVRRLIFGEQRQFERFLGGYVAAFHLNRHKFDLGRALKLHEETDRVAAFYPLDDRRMDATYVFRHDDVQVLPEDRLSFVRKKFKSAGWIAEAMLKAYRGKEPIYFDALTLIDMPHWHQGRVALLGDACGCLTLLAGQGSHMAMAGAYVIARELKRHNGDYAAGFAAYQAMLKPAVAKRQKDAAAMARSFHSVEALAAVAAPARHQADVQPAGAAAGVPPVRRAERARRLHMKKARDRNPAPSHFVASLTRRSFASRAPSLAGGAAPRRSAMNWSNSALSLAWRKRWKKDWNSFASSSSRRKVSSR